MIDQFWHSAGLTSLCKLGSPLCTMRSPVQTQTLKSSCQFSFFHSILIFIFYSTNLIQVTSIQFSFSFFLNFTSISQSFSATIPSYFFLSSTLPKASLMHSMNTCCMLFIMECISKFSMITERHPQTKVIFATSKDQCKEQGWSVLIKIRAKVNNFSLFSEKASAQIAYKHQSRLHLQLACATPQFTTYRHS